MSKRYLFVEGVNLSRTITDTDDLATVRGSSILLETLAESAQAHFGGCLLEEGASRALIRFATGAAPNDGNVEAFLKQEPWRHFTCTYGLGDTPEAAERAARLAQLKMVDIPISASGFGPFPDALNHQYPSQTSRTKAGDPPRDIAISYSVACRRDAGQTLRPWLYTQEDLKPPQSFEDIILRSEDTAFVADAKLAVVKADGMGGTDLRRSFEARYPHDPDQGRIDFNTAIKRLRIRLAIALEDWLEREGLFYRDGMLRVRPLFDVLVWGGDDMTFVMPAEYLMEFLEVFFSEVDRPDPEGFETGFPHRAACIITNYKTPIRQILHLAESADYAVKTALNAHGRYGESAFTVDVFESSALPYDGVLSYRTSLYGHEYQPGADLFMAGDVAKLGTFFIERLGVAEDGSSELSTTQIHRALAHLLQQNAQVSGAKATAIVQVLLNDHYQRLTGCDAPIAEWRASFSDIPRSLPMLLAQAAQLWPYVLRRNAGA